MKKFSAVAVAALLAIGVAGCGGSSDGGGGGGTTEAVATGTSYQVMSKSFELMTPMLAQIGGGAAGQVVKTGDPSVTCTESAGTWTCTVAGEMGGTATLTGTVDYQTYTYSFNAVFTDFRPDADTFIDGSFLWNFTVNPNLFNTASASVKDVFAKSLVSKETEYDCTYENSVDGEGFCAETTTQCTSDSANHYFSYAFTIGPDGFTYTDICGTFTYGAGTTMTMDYCSDNWETGGLFSMTINGTFNGQTVNENFNALCDWSNL
ncbi:MAG: hypothetical protein JXA24_06810 [Proteobacteria bacterium]|nr:hypothetical protein [Pseudomonadota bacterium]